MPLAEGEFLRRFVHVCIVKHDFITSRHRGKDQLSQTAVHRFVDDVVVSLKVFVESHLVGP
jgi:hypothetical protein